MIVQPFQTSGGWSLLNSDELNATWLMCDGLRPCIRCDVSVVADGRLDSVRKCTVSCENATLCVWLGLCVLCTCAQYRTILGKVTVASFAYVRRLCSRVLLVILC